MKKPDLKNFSFDAAASKHARNTYQLHHFSKEWRVGIILLAILKIATMIVSVYAGYYFLYQISLPVLKSHFATNITTIIALIIVELLTMFFISKFFKFLYKGIILTAVFSGIIALSIYTLSFYMSTNGLAMRQSDKVDNSTSILEKQRLEQNNIKAEYSAQLKELDNAIYTIKTNPQGWINGRRAVLTDKQLDRINELMLKKDDLRFNEKKELTQVKQHTDYLLSENQRKQTNEADKYYKYVIAIMIAQLIANGLLMFAWSRIYIEDDRLAPVHEDIAMAESAIISNFFNHITTRLYEESINIQKRIDNDMIKLQPEQAPEIAAENKQEIGFMRNTDPKESQAEPQKQQLYGKLRTNDVLRYSLQKKYSGQLNWTEKKIREQCNVRRWKYYEFYNMMIAAGIIEEPKKYINHNK